MFTGIITGTTEIVKTKESKDGLAITFKRPKNWDDLTLGESIATDGVCLTVAEIRDTGYDCLLMPETLAVTSFGTAVPAVVNVERALSVQDRFGGHFVQGHADGVGTIANVESEDEYRLHVQFDPKQTDLVIHKGSITINGVSLTIASLKDSELSVALIPHTLQHTTLGTLKVGDVVNLEFDMIGKYVAKIMEGKTDATRRTS